MLAPNQQSSMKRPATPTWDALVALALYSVGVMAFLGPALFAGGALVLGHSESDVWKHLWGAWWMGQELGAGRFPDWTDLQNFPAGGRLYVIDPLNAILAALLAPVSGLVQAYNLVLAFQMLSAALAAWALARWLLGDARAALVAGAAYGFCPFLLTSGIASGIAETSNLAWIPLAVLGLLMGLSGVRGPRPILLGGAGLALAALGSWYYGMAALVFTIMLAAWTARHAAPPTPAAPRATWRSPILACLLGSVLVLPVAILFLGTLQGDESLLARIEVTGRMDVSSLDFLHRRGDFKNDADLAGYVLPGKARLSVAEDVDRRLKSVYCGGLVLILALAGLWKGRPWTVFWALAGLGMGLLSVGPFLYVSPGQGLPGPWNPAWAVAFYAVPGFRMVAIADRLSVVVQLCVALLAAAGLARLLPDGRKGTLLACLAAVLVLAEVALISPVPWPTPTAPATLPPQVLALAREPGPRGLIPLPLNRTNTTLQPGEYYYWQIHHGKPMPIALTTRFPQPMMDNRLVGTLYLCEDPNYGHPPPAAVLRPGLTELQRDGFGWFLVNADQMHARTARKVEAVLSGLLPPPLRFPGGALLYRIPEPGKG